MTDESGRFSSDTDEKDGQPSVKRRRPGQRELNAIHGLRTKAFGCEMCEASFGSRMELEEHLNSHSGDRPFECPDCNARFNRRSTLWNHRRIHSDTKPFECPVCGMQFKWKNSLKCHKEMHLRKNEHGELGEQALRESLIPKRRGKYQQRARKKFLGEDLPDDDAAARSIDVERNSSSSTGQSDSRPSSTANAAINLAVASNNNNNSGSSILHTALQRQQQHCSSAAMYSAAAQSTVVNDGHSPRSAASAPIGSQYSPSGPAAVVAAANVMRHLPVIAGIPAAAAATAAANQLPFAPNGPPVFSGSFAAPYPMMPHLPGPMNCFPRISYFGNASSDYTPNMDTYAFDPQAGGYIVKELPFDKW